MISPLAYIDPDAQIGENVEIGPFVFIDKNVVIGDNNVIMPNANILYGSRIGNGNRIFPGIFGLCGRNRFSEYLYLVYFYGLLLSVRIDSRIEGGISIGIGLEWRRSGVSVPDAPT